MSQDSSTPHPKRARFASILVSLCLLAVYLCDSTFYSLGDNLLHLRTAERLLAEGSFLLRPTDVTSSLSWRLRLPDGSLQPVSVTALDAHLNELLDCGELIAEKEPRTMTALARGPVPGTYVSVFQPGAAFVALPAVALARIYYGTDNLDSFELYRFGKFVASVCVAISGGVLCCLLMRIGIELIPAVIFALAYGLGTCVWPVSSQSLWQHGPNELFLILGMYFLIAGEHRTSNAIFAALAMSAATWIRPTSALFAVAGCFGLWRFRRSLLIYMATGAPFAVLLGIYNWRMFGSPLTFGESVVTGDALVTTGSQSVWSTPFLEGMFGLMVSPGRGLFVYSPFLLFSLIGMVRIWCVQELRQLRPWTVAVLVSWVVHFVYYDWWGGWGFGYRPIVDTVPFLIVFIAPLFRMTFFRRVVPASIFGLLLAWSVIIQAVAAYTFDPYDWNGRQIYFVDAPDGSSQAFITIREAEVVSKERQGTIRAEMGNIDLPEYRYRLWSISDNQIPFMMQHLHELRGHRVQRMEYLKSFESQELAATYAALALVRLNMGYREGATNDIEKAASYQKDHPAVRNAMETIRSASGRSGKENP